MSKEMPRTLLRNEGLSHFISSNYYAGTSPPCGQWGQKYMSVPTELGRGRTLLLSWRVLPPQVKMGGAATDKHNAQCLSVLEVRLLSCVTDVLGKCTSVKSSDAFTDSSNHSPQKINKRPLTVCRRAVTWHRQFGVSLTYLLFGVSLA